MIYTCTASEIGAIPEKIEADDMQLIHGMLHFIKDGKTVAILPADTRVRT